MWSRPLVPTLGYKTTDNSPAMVYSGDGSGVNMTATAHLVTELLDDDPNKKGGIVNHVALAKAMGRLTPLAGLTIPRAELAASHLCTILSTAIPLELSIPISKNFYFTDSQSVLAQLGSRQSLYEHWVLSRLRCINSKTQHSDWFKVDGLQNAADIPSKIHTKPPQKNCFRSSSAKDDLWKTPWQILSLHCTSLMILLPQYNFYFYSSKL